MEKQGETMLENHQHKISNARELRKIRDYYNHKDQSLTKTGKEKKNPLKSFVLHTYKATQNMSLINYKFIHIHP